MVGFDCIRQIESQCKRWVRIVFFLIEINTCRLAPTFSIIAPESCHISLRFLIGQLPVMGEPHECIGQSGDQGIAIRRPASMNAH